MLLIFNVLFIFIGAGFLIGIGWNCLCSVRLECKMNNVSITH